MTATIKRYDTHPYDTTFAATVLSATPGKTGQTVDVVLDETLFFPEEGGQTPDRGILAGFHVTDVQIDKEGVITHTLDLPRAMSGAEMDAALAVGSKVDGTLDWSHRYSNMQNHSGEHVLSGLLHTLYGYENVGFRLSDNTVTLDTSGQLTDEQIRDLERLANEIVWRNVPITCAYPEPEVLETLEYRSKKAIDGPVRIVTIEGVDACACCAPHVARTGEIGLIKILDVLHERNDMRLTIACGSRALAEMQAYQQALTDVSHLVKTPRTETPAGTQHLLDEISRLKEEARGAWMRYAKARYDYIGIFEDLDANLERVPLWTTEPPMDPLAQRELMNRLCERGYRYVGVFCGSDTEGWNYLIGSRVSDARIPNNILRERLQARGGGKPEMVQGSIPAIPRTELLTVLNSVLE